MNPVWIAFAVGLIIGTFLGLLWAGMLQSRRDDKFWGKQLKGRGRG